MNFQITYFQQSSDDPELELFRAFDGHGKPPSGFTGRSMDIIPREASSFPEEELNIARDSGLVVGWMVELYSMSKDDSCNVQGHYENSIMKNTKKVAIWEAIDVDEDGKQKGKKGNVRWRDLPEHPDHTKDYEYFFTQSLGRLVVEKSGPYEFRIESSDGSVLYLNDDLVR